MEFCLADAVSKNAPKLMWLYANLSLEKASLKDANAYTRYGSLCGGGPKSRSCRLSTRPMLGIPSLSSSGTSLSAPPRTTGIDQARLAPLRHRISSKEVLTNALPRCLTDAPRTYQTPFLG